MIIKLRNFQNHDKHGDDSIKRVEQISIDHIKPNPYQPRKEFSQNGLEELSQSIREYGLIQPITVRKLAADSYELIAGERRLRACKLIGMNAIPSIVMDSHEEDSAVIAMVENLQRENLHYLEEAKGYASLINDHGLTQEELAKKVGKSQSTIANKLRILKLPDEIKELMVSNHLTERHSRALLKLHDEELQMKAAQQIIHKNLSVKDTEIMIERMLEKLQQTEVSGKANRKFIKAYKDLRIIINTIKGAVDTMKQHGLTAQYEQVDKGDSIEITLKIPKG